MKLPSRIQADIDLDAFAFNLESIKNNLKEDTKIITVLKQTDMDMEPCLWPGKR